MFLDSLTRRERERKVIKLFLFPPIPFSASTCVSFVGTHEKGKKKKKKQHATQLGRVACVFWFGGKIKPLLEEGKTLPGSSSSSLPPPPPPLVGTKNKQSLRRRKSRRKGDRDQKMGIGVGGEGTKKVGWVRCALSIWENEKRRGEKSWNMMWGIGTSTTIHSLKSPKAYSVWYHTIFRRGKMN